MPAPRPVRMIKSRVWEVGTQLKCAGRDTSWQSSQLTVHGARKGNTIHHVLTRYGTDAGAVPARMSSATTTGLASHHA
jgi:hypothetical protein